jgi:aldehyde reductase
MSITSLPLSNGFSMPTLGLGTYKEENPEVLVKAVKAALAAGYRHFDCAYCYNNEHIIGKALRDAIEESNGSLKREDLFITSKCWNTFHSKEAVAGHIDECLKKFGFDYLDLFLIHWPMGFKEEAGDFPMGEDGKPLLSDVHYTETYKVSFQSIFINSQVISS